MDLDLISNTVLFRGCPKEDIEAMARHLNFRTNQYKKGNVVFHSGEIITDAGGVFGEAYACIPSQPLLIDVTANTDCRILLISIPGLFSPCPVCQSQRQVIQNLLIISAQKNLRLSERSLDTSPKTIRGRLLSYFSRQISLQGTSTVTIPFDRQQLADYLNLDRSALSKELGKMKREHLIQYHKNVFQINIHAIKAT